MSLVSPHVLVWFRQLGGDLGDVLSPPFSWSLSPWGSFSQGIGCGTHRFQSGFVGHHFATFIRVCVLGGRINPHRRVRSRPKVAHLPRSRVASCQG